MKEINLKDIIQKEQLGLRRLCGGLSSRRRQIIVIQCITANIAQIMTSRFTGKIWLKKATHLAVACSIMPTRHKKDATHYWGSKKSSILRKQIQIRVERKIVRWILMEQKTWLNCIIVTDKPEFNCFEYKKFLSQYAGNLHTNNLWSQMIFKGSSCIPAILLRVQRRT